MAMFIGQNWLTSGIFIQCNLVMSARDLQNRSNRRSMERDLLGIGLHDYGG